MCEYCNSKRRALKQVRLRFYRLLVWCFVLVLFLSCTEQLQVVLTAVLSCGPAPN